MHSLRLGSCLMILLIRHIQAGDSPKWVKWTQLSNTLKNPNKLEEALQNDKLPYDEDSLIVISIFIKKHAPKDHTGSPCCIRKTVETDPMLEDLIEFHKKHVSSLRKRRNSNGLSEDERSSLAIIEKDVKKMPKSIRRSYGELPSLD